MLHGRHPRRQAGNRVWTVFGDFESGEPLRVRLAPSPPPASHVQQGVFYMGFDKGADHDHKHQACGDACSATAGCTVATFCGGTTCTMRGFGFQCLLGNWALL